MSEIMEGDYQGNAILILRQTSQDKFPFQFGVKKARLIMEHLSKTLRRSLPNIRCLKRVKSSQHGYWLMKSEPDTFLD